MTQTQIDTWKCSEKLFSIVVDNLEKCKAGIEKKLEDNSGIEYDIIYKKYVEGKSLKIIAEEVRVQLQANWPDYVFSEDYELQDLKSLEKSIRHY